MRSAIILFVLYLCKYVFFTPQPNAFIGIGLGVVAAIAFCQDIEELKD